MTVHIEIDGRPWCCWYDASVFRRLYDSIHEGQVRMPPICAYMDRETAQKESVEVLARYGVTATVVDGPCPEYGKSYEEDE